MLCGAQSGLRPATANRSAPVAYMNDHLDITFEHWLLFVETFQVMCELCAPGLSLCAQLIVSYCIMASPKLQGEASGYVRLRLFVVCSLRFVHNFQLGRHL